MAPDHSAHSLRVPGGELAYDDAGAPHAPPVVLIHQAIADRRVWEPVFQSLSKKYRVIRYDLRGYGRSPPAQVDFSNLEDLHRLLIELRLTKPILVGASLGGRIALDYSLGHRGAVSGLVLIAPGFSGMDYPMFPEGVFAEDDRISKAAQDSYSSGQVDAAIEHLRSLWAAALAGNDLELFQRMVRENSEEVFLDRSAQHDHTTEPKAATRLASLEVPVIVLVGDRDNPAMPHVARYISDHVQQGRTRIVAGADHFLNLGNPRVVVESVDELAGRPSPER